MNVRLNRYVPRRVGKLGKHFVGSHVPEQLFRTHPRLRLSRRRVHQSRIGKPVQRHIVAKPGLSPSFPVRIENCFCTVESRQKCCLHKATFAHTRRATGARRTHPARWVRLLIRAWPDVNHSVMKKATLMTEWPFMMGPRLNDQVKRLPVTLVHTNRIAVRCGDLPRYPAHESHLYPALR